MKWVGIDPGQMGGVAILSDDPDFQGEAISFKDKTEKDIAETLRRHSDADFAFIENVHSMPKQGVASSFKFGRNLGVLVGCLAAMSIPYDYVTPQAWQKAMGCMSKGNKNVTKAKAQRLFPTFNVTHQISDALLIAQYCKNMKGAN